MLSKKIRPEQNLNIIEEHIATQVQKEFGLSYIHCPYPNPIPFESKSISNHKNVIVVIGYDNACGIVVLVKLIAFPDKFDEIAIFLLFV